MGIEVFADKLRICGRPAVFQGCGVRDIPDHIVISGGDPRAVCTNTGYQSRRGKSDHDSD